MNRESNVSPNRSKKGFFAALAVCLVAIGVAAWSAYSSVTEYQNTAASTAQSITPVVSFPQIVTGESLETSEAPSSPEPVASSEAEAVVSAVSQPVLSSAAEEAAAPVVDTLEKPVAGAAVSLAFSETPLYNETMQDWRAHAGVDYEAKAGTQVLAAADGTVEDVSQDGLWGTVVKLSHAGGLMTWYCGLQENLVQQGDVLSAGDPLGTVGSVPCEQKDVSHLHFAVEKDGAFLDPASYLS